ncbi:MAG: AI-2E family transporter [Candidatus Pacebacteria bacterium]|nr:AI-2E family transporter [Candidatus Paceibacterota bacterium]
MKRNVLEMSFFLLLIFAGVTFLFFIFKPYLLALFVGLIFAIVFAPVYQKLNQRLNGRATISSLITVILVLVVILIPLFVLGTVLFQEAKDATIQLQQGDSAALFLEEKISAIEGYVNDLAPDANFNIDLRKIVVDGVNWIAKNLNVLFSEFAKGTINLFLMIISLFFFLRDGEKIKKTVIEWSPLDDKYDERILKKMTTAVNSVIKGTLFIAAIQGFLSGIGFAIFGVPSPVLWGSIAAIAALIPSVGTGLILMPAVLYLYFSAAPLWALIGLVVWGVGVVGLVDNFLRPILIEKGIKIHPFLILLSVFGGISFFGPIGFLAGPITLSFVFALIDVCPKVLKK